MLMKGSIEKDGEMFSAEVKECQTDKECSAMLVNGWDLITVVAAGDNAYRVRYIVGRYIPEADAKKIKNQKGEKE